MNVHILYHGLGMSGKTTNLEKLKEIYSGFISDRVHQKTEEGRTVYVDMLALNVKTRSGDKEVNISLFTTPGQERFRILRSWLFGHVDGIVFVLDSTRSIEENMKAYEEIRHYKLSRVPIVVQANKRDVEGALPLTAIQQAFNGCMVVEAVAYIGMGVAETFRLVLKEVLDARAFAR